MAYLTIAQYRTQSGQSLTGLSDGYIDFQLAKWSRQITRLLNQDFTSTVNNQTLLVDVKNCGNFVFKLKAFLETDLIVKVKTKQNPIWTVLVKDINYQVIYPKFDTYVNDTLQTKPVTGLDFSCYRCNCECEQFQIIGDHRWSNGLPDDLRDILYNLIETMLTIDSKAYTTGIIPIKLKLNDIQIDRDQTREVRWFLNENQIITAQDKMRLGINYPEYWEVLEKYIKASINLYQRIRI